MTRSNPHVQLRTRYRFVSVQLVNRNFSSPALWQASMASSPFSKVYDNFGVQFFCEGVCDLACTGAEHMQFGPTKHSQLPFRGSLV